MDIKNVLANALRRAGYNMQLDTIEKTELYKQAQEILNFMESSFQSNLRFQEAKKIAVLQRIDNTHDNFYGDFDRYDIDYEIYSLPEDFLEYITCTADYEGDDAQIMNNFLFVKKSKKYSIIDDKERDKPWFVYRSKLPIEDFPDYAERYVSLAVALELVLSYKSNDGNKINALSRELQEEKQAMARRDNMRFSLTMKNKRW